MPGRLFELWARNANASKRGLTSRVAGCIKAFQCLAQNRRDRLADNSKVQREGHVLRIENVHRNHLVKCSPVLPVNLPIAGYAGRRVDPLTVFRSIALKFNQGARAWSDQAHLPANDVEDLGQLIQTGGSKEASTRDETSIKGIKLGHGRVFLHQLFEILFVRPRVGIYMHASEFKDHE